jgi:hypothetical protein
VLASGFARVRGGGGGGPPPPPKKKLERETQRRVRNSRQREVRGRIEERFMLGGGKRW